MKEKIALIGAGGHCKIVIDLIEELNQYEIIGIYDDNKIDFFENIKILGNISSLDTTIDNFFICIGNENVRKNIYTKFNYLNYPVLIHPSAIISKKAKICDGTLICAGAVIQTGVIINKQCIINTSSTIDHESYIDEFSSVSPNAVICGRVKIGKRTFIGANATIIQCKEIGDDCVIGAGSVIIKNIGNNIKIVGNPGKILPITTSL